MSQRPDSSEIKVHLLGEGTKVFQYRPTVLEVAHRLCDRKAARKVVGGKLEKTFKILDVRDVVENESRLKLIFEEEGEEALEVLRHSTAHVMAEAVQSLWPGTLLALGPVTESGFYYDFYSSSVTFSPQDLEKIEKKMKSIIQRNNEMTKEVWIREKALAFFKERGETFKVKVLEEIIPEGEEISVYSQGQWLDLCRGPHVQRLGQIKAFKLLSLSGCYWRGDEKGPRLQRIYGTAFYSQKDLSSYLKKRVELQKRDHRKMGKELSLFYFHPSSPGSAFFTPRGTLIYQELKNFIRELYLKYGYQEVISPQIFDIDFYKQSGHYANYFEDMYLTETERREFAIKPMNCPGHCLLYKMEKHSYRDLPLRLADFGRLHRRERSGVLHGLNRVRSFVQDDAHIFCPIENLPSEVKSFKDFLEETYKVFGLNQYKVFLSTRPQKRMGEEAIWDRAEGLLKEALEDLNWDHEILSGEGAFYGPKLDIVVKDSLSRKWQLGTLQCDFNMPRAFSLKYVGRDNQEHFPLLLHRAILGSIERFMGVYLEHTGGHLPLWLSPVQVILLNVTDRELFYCQELKKKLENGDEKGRFSSIKLRVQLDQRQEKLGFKIRSAQMNKIPYMIIIGDKEVKKTSLSLRLRSGIERELSLDEFILGIREELLSRALQSPWEKSVKRNGYRRAGLKHSERQDE